MGMPRNFFHLTKGMVEELLGLMRYAQGHTLFVG
jgi:hypothetical protein